jgi:hypothetical protein
MESTSICEYKEQFLFRTRVHQLYPYEIKTVQDDFFNSSEKLTRIVQLGNMLQYQSETKLFEILSAIALLLLGIKGYTRSTTDDFLFLISTGFTFAALYWILTVVFQVKYVGSFYFSNFSIKEDNFEIKSRYPPSREREQFLEAIKIRQKAIAIEDLIHTLTADWTAYEIQEHLIYMQRTYNLTEVESQALQEQLLTKLNSLKNRNSGTAPDSSGN